MVSENTNSREASPGPTALVLFLLIASAALVILGLIGGLTALVRSASWLWAVISLVGSCCVAGVLLALAWLCRRGHQQEQAEGKMVSALERIAGELQAAPVRHVEQGAGDRGAEEVSETSPADRAEAMLAQLRELNANLMLTDAQRLKKARDLAERRANRLTEQAEEAISAGDLAGAEDILGNLTRLEPDSPDVPALRERIKQACDESESHDASEAGRQVENLMAASDFAGARAVAEAMLGKHPDSIHAVDMLARVSREAEAFATEQQGQMYRKIEKAASARHWHSALAAARKFLDAWPDSIKADAVRAQLSTIADNARIEEVRILRDQIRDMITRRRFGEAVEMAQDVIERFPETAAANELTLQMARLQERAKSEEKR